MRILNSICLIVLLNIGLSSCKSEQPAERPVSNTDTIDSVQQQSATTPCLREGNQDYYCDKPECLDTIAMFHSISEDKFNAMRGFFPSDEPGVYTAQAIMDTFEHYEANCREWRTKIYLEDGTIKFGVEKMRGVYYSMALILGILQHTAQAERFIFYHAKKLHNNDEDYVFSVDFADGTTRFYDLSESIP